MKDKIVLLTGATSGIGFQTALALAKMDAQVIVTGRNKPNVEGYVQLNGRIIRAEKITRGEYNSADSNPSK